jgi:hypothetical protein
MTTEKPLWGHHDSRLGGRNQASRREHNTTVLPTALFQSVALTDGTRPS